MDERKELREQYHTLTGKNAFPGWSVEEIRERMENYSPGSTKTADENIKKKPNFRKYRELPPPVVEHLEKTFGAWLSYMEIGQEYKEDFGGYGMYIKVPEQFSTEWKTIETYQYDNRTRQPKKDKNGNPIVIKVTTEDIRWKNLQNIPDVINWLNMVKEKIIRDAYTAGIQLPNTKTKLSETEQTLKDFEQSVHAR